MKAKRILLLGLVIALSVSLAGCKKNEDQNNNLPNNNNSQIVLPDSGLEENEDQEVNGEENFEDDFVEDNFEDEEDFGDEDVPEMPTTEVYNIMTTLASTATINVRMPMQDAIPADQAETFIGLTQDVFEANVEESVFIESMISPANESYCLVKVKEGSDVEALKQTIFDNCNPIKWICMSAERVVVANSGNYILLGMGAKESCDSILTEFTNHFNNEVGSTLDKMVDSSNIDMSDLPGGAL